jgi:hypothetical protein
VTGSPANAAKIPLKSARWIGRQPASARAALDRRFREDHCLHDRQAVRIVEHALGAAEPDSLGAVAAARGRRRGAYRHWP